MDTGSRTLMSANTADIIRPLCVDMDGTVLATDVLWESLLLLLKTKPLSIFLLPVWLLKGKAFFKRQVAQRVVMNAAILPYHQEVLSFLREEKAAGKEIILASASDQQVAEGIASFLGMFSTVLGSDGKVNLSGQNKAKALEEYTGNHGFDYMGNGHADLSVWKAAHRTILVNASSRLLRKVCRFSTPQRVFSPQTNRLSSCLKALRVHQWVKNILLFVPLVMAHKVTEIQLVLQAGYGFLAFSLCASSGYILNDLLDLEADRQHPYKQHRPFAAGLLQIETGVLLVPLLLGCAFLISALLLPRLFIVTLGLYFVLTTAYSLYLKRTLILDVLLLAAFYSLRVWSGGTVVDVAISPWLIAFSMFLFLSLAFLKRYSELLIVPNHNQSSSNGRSYVLDDKELLRSVGLTSGYLSVLVFALYINSSKIMTLYQHPMALWFIAPILLYWITRMWFMANRGLMTDDPVVFTVKDWVSYVLGALSASIVVLAAL